MWNGVIVVHKEAGFTSHDVVAKLRGILRQKKIGHTGTLDPEATGVLPVCIGSGTKLCDMLTDKRKEYVAEVLLGVKTDTQDTTGEVLARSAVTVSQEDVRAAVEAFLGQYEQIPPMYSALKVNGKKLYELAREGKEVERKARPVQIYELEILEMRLPVIKIRVLCSKGTYIRTLSADIGEKLGCGAAMQSLVRTRVGSFGLEDALTLDRIERLRDEGRIDEILHPVDSLFADCPALHVKRAWEKLPDNGNPVFPGQTLEKCVYEPGKWVRLYRENGEFVGIYSYEERGERYKPVKMFLN